MAEGTVIWFNAAKSFGMIGPDEQSPDVSVHFSSIERSGRRELTEGERVTFDAVTAPKGPRTTRVRPFEADDHRA